ncbi:MAG: twin-arginine translocation signal domain-containing protein, partial [Pseudomonadota bacterium]
MTNANNPSAHAESRRRFLQRSLAASGVLAIGPGLWGCANQGSPRSALGVNRIASTSNIPNLSRDLVEIPVDNDPQTQMRVPRG